MTKSNAGAEEGISRQLTLEDVLDLCDEFNGLEVSYVRRGQIAQQLLDADPRPWLLAGISQEEFFQGQRFLNCGSRRAYELRDAYLWCVEHYPQIRELDLAVVRNHAELLKLPNFPANAWACRQEMEGKPHVSHASGENEWYTPPEYIAAARAVLGEIDLDPASTERANEVVQAAQFYSPEDDGLAQHWQGRVFMNPPYASGLIEKFTEKLGIHYDDGDVPMAIVLVNNATETDWFQRLARRATAFCFPDERIPFWSPNGEMGAPLQGQALMYLGPEMDGFEEAFKHLGLILYAAR